jgi:hypothetical protein
LCFGNPVGGSLPANRFGLADMIGNVLEWVEDCHRPDYRGAKADGKAEKNADCKERAARGGAWLENPRDLRSARRHTVPPDGTENIIGFRLGRDLSCVSRHKMFSLAALPHHRPHWTVSCRKHESRSLFPAFHPALDCIHPLQRRLESAEG